MSWNGSRISSPSLDEAEKNNDGSKRPLLFRGVITGLAVVILGAGVVWFVRNGRATHPQKIVSQPSNKPGVIVEITPSAPAKPRPAKQKPGAALQARYPELNIPDSWDKPYPPQAYRADGSLKRHSRYVTVYTNRMSKSEMPLADRTFSNIAERDIANALMINPGEILVGDYEFDDKFISNFLDSLKNLNLPEKDDTEEQKALRSLVNEAKKELKAAYDRGENIAQIMTETRQQFKELGLYKLEIEKLVAEARKNSQELNGELSQQDEHDLVEAANKMLEDRGCEPLALPDTFIEKATHSSEQAKD